MFEVEKVALKCEIGVITVLKINIVHQLLTNIEVKSRTEEEVVTATLADRRVDLRKSPKIVIHWISCDGPLGGPSVT